MPAALRASIRRVVRLTERERNDLTEILVACVAEGASLGFLPPLTRELAWSWWARLPQTGIALYIAERDGRVIGTVQLHDASSANGAHRGEVAKLMIHPSARRQGLARELMLHLETEARAVGKTLLVLDTREGDPSNDLYRALGYHEGGRIPDWARNSFGGYSATVFWYKLLD